MAEEESIYVKVKLKNDELEAGLKESGKTIESFSSKAEKSFGKAESELLKTSAAANHLARETAKSERVLRSFDGVVDLTGDGLHDLNQETDDASRGLQDFRDSVDKGASSTDDSTRSLKGWAAGAAAAVAIAAVLGKKTVDLANAQASHAHELEQYSQRLAISHKELKTLQGVAREFGVETEDINEGLKNMKERLGEALLEGRGATFDAISKLGLDLEELDAMDTKEQFLTIADALSKVEDAGRRTFLQMEIGQEEFFKMGTVIQQGRKELEKLIEKQEELDRHYDPKKLLEYRDATNKLGNAWEAAKDAAASGLSPALQDVAEHAEAGVKGLLAFQDTDSVFDGIIEGMRAFDREFDLQLDFVDHGEFMAELNAQIDAIELNRTLKLELELELNKLGDALISDNAKVWEDYVSAINSGAATVDHRSDYDIKQEKIKDKENRDALRAQQKKERDEQRAERDRQRKLKEFERDYDRRIKEEQNKVPEIKLAGLLERGSAEELKARKGDENRLEIERNKHLKAIEMTLKKQKKLAIAKFTGG